MGTGEKQGSGFGRRIVAGFVLALLAVSVWLAANSYASVSGVADDSGDPLYSERSSTQQRARAADAIEQALAGSGIKVEQRAYSAPNVHWTLDLVMPTMRGINVVAQIPATQPSQHNIIIGAHYDSEAGSPGVDDNTSGVLGAILVAAKLNQLPARNANIFVVLFDQEEEDTIGSNHFAKQWAASGQSLHSMHNLDMIGYDENDDGVFDLDAPDGPVREAYEAAAQELGITLARAEYNSSDHYPFRTRGYVAAFLTENLSDGDFNYDLHTARDNHIDRQYMQRGADLMAAAIERLVTP